MACLWLGWNRFGRAELDWQASASLSWIWLGSPELDGVRFGRVGVGLDWFGWKINLKWMMFSNLTISYDFLSIRLNLIYREQTSFFIIIFYLILAYISSYILINHDYLTIRFFSFLSWANLTDHVSRSVYKWPNNINSKIKIVTTIPPKTPYDPCRRLSKRYWGVVICFILFCKSETRFKDPSIMGQVT